MPNTMNKLPLAVAYFRMSKDEQTDSIEAQKARVYPFFEGKVRFVHEYIDSGKSGSKDTDKRINFLRMIEDLTVGSFSKGEEKVQFVCCLNSSRFGRLDTIEGAEHKQQLRKARVKLWTIDEIIDWNSATGRIVDAVKSEANNDLSLKIGSLGLAGRIRVTLEGKPNQTTPYGMAKEVTASSGEKLVIKRGQKFSKPKTWDSEFIPGDEREVEAIQFLFATFVSNDISFNQLAVRLTEADYPSPTGDGWRGDTITWMLSNPVYAGGLRIGVIPKGEFFRAIKGKETSVNEIDEDKKEEPTLVWGCHKGIIDRAVWDEAQRKIKRNFKTRRPPRKGGPYALTGIIHCGNCGRPMYGSRNPKGAVIYRCHRGEIDPTKNSLFKKSYG
jgi:DNA invertase Pin-like site-specific DNA recombinase